MAVNDIMKLIDWGNIGKTSAPEAPQISPYNPNATYTPVSNITPYWSSQPVNTGKSEIAQNFTGNLPSQGGSFKDFVNTYSRPKYPVKSDDYGDLPVDPWSVQPAAVAPQTGAVQKIMQNVSLGHVPEQTPTVEVLPSETAATAEEPAGFWDKAFNFLGTPAGRSLGAGLLTSGLVGLTGGSGLEALAYGAQSGGTASNVYRQERNRELKRQQEDRYFTQKAEQEQQRYDLEQQKLANKTQQDYESAQRDLANKLGDMVYKGVADPRQASELARQYGLNINYTNSPYNALRADNLMLENMLNRQMLAQGQPVNGEVPYSAINPKYPAENPGTDTENNKAIDYRTYMGLGGV